uniref:Putative gamma-secretase subunit PEN-2 n=1 Tax=Rhizophora mucronata TaxID=61149 RepID=A0A2P2P3V2_RHIMU
MLYCRGFGPSTASISGRSSSTPAPSLASDPMFSDLPLGSRHSRLFLVRGH